MPKGVWIRSGPHAIPADERSMEFLLSIKEGTPFIADTHGARNPKQLRLWWALCRLVSEQFDVTEESISDDLKIALGHTETVKSWNGTVKVKPRSIAFEKLEQEIFNNLLTSAVNKVAEWLGSSPKEVQKRFYEITADKRYVGMMR
jgi:hypothetical protein